MECSPDDMNCLYVDVLIDWHERFEENFGVFWLMVRELVDLDLDSYEVFHCGYVRLELAPLFGDGQKQFPQDFPENEKIHYRSILKPPLKDTVRVQWNIGTLRNYGKYSLQGLLKEKLLPLGPPDKVRIIYWFDW